MRKKEAVSAEASRGQETLAITTVQVLSEWQHLQHMPFPSPALRQGAMPCGPDLLIYFVKDMSPKKWLALALNGETALGMRKWNASLIQQESITVSSATVTCFLQNCQAVDREGHGKRAGWEPGAVQTVPHWINGEWQRGRQALVFWGRGSVRRTYCLQVHWSILIWLSLY